MANERSEVRFDPLVEASCLSVSLRVEGRRHPRADDRQPAEFLPRLGSKSGVAVRENISGESVVLPDFPSKNDG